MGSSGRRTHPVMPASAREAPITFRKPRRETESTHSEAPLGNSRCSISWKLVAAGEFFEAAPVFRAGFFVSDPFDLGSDRFQIQLALLAGANVGLAVLILVLLFCHLGSFVHAHLEFQSPHQAF